MAFAHLHHHTCYSILDGMDKVEDYVGRVKELGQMAAAITDHGTMYGAVEFYKACKKEGINPVIGCEVYVAKGDRRDKTGKGRGYYHLVLLCENNEGYRNLSKLVSLSNTEGFYYKPRVDRELLERHHGGLIALSACVAGELARAAQRGYEEAKEVALWHDRVFGRGNYFLEMQDHKDGSEEQAKANQAIMRIHTETGIPIVATNDNHYARPEDAEAHEVLLCMQTKKTLDDPDHMVYEGGQYYVKSEEEMLALFPYAREAVENAQKIADRCRVELEFNNYHIPPFEAPEGYAGTKEYLAALCEEGFGRRYARNPLYSGDEKERLHEEMLGELETIDRMGFVEYILIVWDYINWAREHGSPVGPGRGSAAGSKVCYCIGITNIDPARYGLVFERFLNPERVSMPDIDVDFSDRDYVINEYVKPKYGADCSSLIVTFQNMKARAVLKDVGRVLGIPYQETNRVSKMVPDEPKMTIRKALDLNPDLRRYLDEGDEMVGQWFRHAMALENTPKSTSTHAAGVVIYPEKAEDCVPIAMSKDGEPTASYDMVQMEELGYLKMDFLGLRTLQVIKDAVENVKRTRGVEVDVDAIDVNDPKVLEFIGTGRTSGVFQLESKGMQQFMRKLRPRDFEDVIAGVSLYRPGPMDFIPQYIEGKEDPGNVRYKCPQLEPILRATYGCIVYQEQVMQIFQQLAGYSMGQADNIRRAMSK